MYKNQLIFVPCYHKLFILLFSFLSMKRILQEYSYYMQDALHKVFASWKYSTASIGLFGLFILLNLLLMEYLLAGSIIFSSIPTFLDSLWYYWMSMPPNSKIFLMIISLLSALLIVSTFFAYRQNQQMNSSYGNGGIILGMLAPACPSCGIGAISLLGFGGLAAVLPFGGQEIAILAVLVLLGSFVYVSKQISAPSCKVK